MLMPVWTLRDRLLVPPERGVGDGFTQALVIWVLAAEGGFGCCCGFPQKSPEGWALPFLPTADWSQNVLIPISLRSCARCPLFPVLCSARTRAVCVCLRGYVSWCAAAGELLPEPRHEWLQGSFLPAPAEVCRGNSSGNELHKQGSCQWLQAAQKIQVTLYPSCLSLLPCQRPARSCFSVTEMSPSADGFVVP